MKVECDAYYKCYITSTIDSVHYGTTSMSHSPHSTPALSAFVRYIPLGPTTAQSTSRRTVRTLRRDHGASGRPHASQTSHKLHCSLCATAMPRAARSLVHRCSCADRHPPRRASPLRVLRAGERARGADPCARRADPRSGADLCARPTVVRPCADP